METNSPAEVSSDPEAMLAAAFEKAGVSNDEVPPPEDDEPSSEPEAEEVEASDADESDEEPDAEAQPEETDDSEEVEYEGKSYKLPKELKDALLRQQDYTKKTQDVAEKRRTVEEQAQQVEMRAQFQAAHFAKAVEAQSLQTQLQQYAQVKWAELAESNPAQYLQLDRQHRELQEAANRVNADIQHLAVQFQAEVQQSKQQAQARCIEELRKEFKDFGPTLLKSLDETGKSFGFSGEELSNVTDPRIIRVLHAAAQYQKLQGSKSLIAKKVQDAKPMQVKAARTAQSSLQTKQLADVRSRLKSSGRPADAEALLSARFAKSMR